MVSAKTRAKRITRKNLNSLYRIDAYGSILPCGAGFVANLTVFYLEMNNF